MPFTDRSAVLCILYFTPLLTVPCPYKPEKKSTRTWRIETHTGTDRDAASNAFIYTRLRVGQAWSEPMLLDQPKDNFERGAVDVFTVTSQSRGRLSGIHVYVSRDGEDNESWQLVSIKVQDVNDPTQARFCLLNTWLANHPDPGKHFVAC